MINKFTTYFSNLKLRNKFLIAYAGLLLVPLILTMFIFYSWLIPITKVQTEEIAQQTIKQAELHIAQLKQQVENIGDMIFWDKDIRKLLKDKGGNAYSDVEEYNTIINSVMSIEQSVKSIHIRYFVSDNKLYARDNQTIFSLNLLQENQPFQSLLESDSKIGWISCSTNIKSYTDKKNTLSYMVIINDFDNLNQVLGCIFIDVLEDEFNKILNEIKIGKDGLSFIHDGNGNIISTTNKYRELKEEILLAKVESDNQFELNGIQISAIRERITNSDWEIIHMLPSKEIMKNVQTNLKFTYFIIMVCIATAVVIAILFTNKITNRIYTFIRRMEKSVDIVNLPDIKNCYNKDEIGQMQFHFDQAMNKISVLVKENYQVQLQKREAELKALQAQINPHFLYNVLDSISWMAIRAGSTSISNMVADLGRFYRIGLSQGRGVIRIREELEHVHTYIKIQKTRFEDTIDVEIQVAEDIMDCPIVKLTLQPIVENAIIHGILTKVSQSGVIRIVGERANGMVLIRIIDDGIGLDFAKVKYILSDPNSQFSKGFGIKNVDERIKLYFGAEYGINITRKEERWTVVAISLPYIIYQ